MVKKLGIAVVLLTMAGAASAEPHCKPSDHNNHGSDRACRAPAKAPEISAASAAAGLTLLLGGLAVLRSRQTKKAIKA